MGILLEHCVKMDDGRLLCYDADDGCAYVIDPKKTRATTQNVSAKEWMRFALEFGAKTQG